MILLYLLLLAIGLCIIRVILGPTAPDRVIAIDAMSALFIVLLVLFGIEYQQKMLIDIAIAFSILAFIGTIAISKYLEGKKLFIKPNFTSVTRQLAATHIDTIRAVLDFILNKELKPKEIIVGEGSGTGNTSAGFKNFNYHALKKEYNVELVLTGHTHHSRIYDSDENLITNLPLNCNDYPTLYVQTDDCKQGIHYRNISITSDGIILENTQELEYNPAIKSRFTTKPIINMILDILIRI